MQVESIKSPTLEIVKSATKASVSLSEFDLRTLWTAGILNDAAYVALILKLKESDWRQSRNFDCNEFAIEWEATYEDANQNVKTKTLKVKVIRDAIDKLVKAELASSQSQLSLKLTW